MLNNILLIEDDHETALLLKEYLDDVDFSVDIFDTVTSAISSINFKEYSSILLDINMPDFNGFEVLKFLSKNKINIPVIVISAYSDKNIKLQAFKLGANDYMVKPIDPEELEARIWVQLRNHTDLTVEKTKTFEISENTIYFDAEPLNLTKTEFDILSLLIKNKNSVVKRDYLLDFLSSISINNRSLDYHIKNIRKKLKDNATNPKYLITEYGVGYKICF
ncbi:MAG: response regulator transcription factor [Campylobacterota bacterium]